METLENSGQFEREIRRYYCMSLGFVFEEVCPEPGSWQVVGMIPAYRHKVTQRAGRPNRVQMIVSDGRSTCFIKAMPRASGGMEQPNRKGQSISVGWCSWKALDEARQDYSNAMVYGATYQHISWLGIRLAKARYLACTACTVKQLSLVWWSAGCIPTLAEDWRCNGSVTFATISMIWLETPVVAESREHILLYKRFLDDIFMICSGLSAQLYQLQAKFEGVNNPEFKSLEDGNLNYGNMLL